MWTSFQLINIAQYFFPLHFREITYAKKVSAVGTLWKSFVDQETKETIFVKTMKPANWSKPLVIRSDRVVC